MDRITITDGVITVTLPKSRSLRNGGERVAKEVVLAGGKEVSDYIGFRPTLEYSEEYVPVEDIADLVTMLRRGVFLTVSYPDTDGTDKTGVFKVSYPTCEVFTYRNGNPVWTRVNLTFTAQEVQ